MLICVVGLLPGDSAVDPGGSIVIVSHECVDRIVARSDRMFVCGTTSKLHVISPLVGGGGFGSVGFTWIVTVPRHLPVKNDVGPDGQVGVPSRSWSLFLELEDLRKNDHSLRQRTFDIVTLTWASDSSAGQSKVGG